MKNDLLITGGTGLVGSAIDVGTKVSSSDVDLRIAEDTFNFFEKQKP